VSPNVQLPTIGHECAECDSCELKVQRDNDKCVASPPPIRSFNGLMIIGEGPGKQEVVKRMPFVGKSGSLLDDLLAAADIDRDATWITNATLCMPPVLQREDETKNKRAGFTDRFPQAVPSCLPRLERELEIARPRVVVCMGNAAVHAATLYTIEKAKQVPSTCTKCDPKTRKIGPVIKCATGDCSWFYAFDEEHTRGEELLKQVHKDMLDTLDGKCPQCAANIKKLRPRLIKCPACGGRKTIATKYLEWKSDYTVTSVVGSLLDPKKLGSRWDRFGVEWIIPAFHPSFLLRPIDDEKKAFGWQFAIPLVVSSLEKAKRLLERPPNFKLRKIYTDNPTDVEEYTREVGFYDLDVETDAKAWQDVTEIRCIGIGRADREEVLVVDTRGLAVNVGTDTHHKFEIRDPELHAALANFLTREDSPKAGQNAGSYDYNVMRRVWGIKTEPIGGDTKSAHHVLRPNSPHNLAIMGAEFTEAEHWKEPKKVGGALVYRDWCDLADYNARDVRVTSLTREIITGQPCLPPLERKMPTGVVVKAWSQGGRLATEGLRDVYDVDMAVAPIATEMEWVGLPLNVERMKEIDAETRAKLAGWKSELIHLSGLKDFNPDSTPQIQYVLFHPSGPFKLTAKATTKTGAPSTAAEDLAQLVDHPFVRFLVDYRKLDGARKNHLHGKDIIIRDDSALHISWNTTGAVTGRFSTSPNQQNVPEWLREIVQAWPGWKILGADYSQLELRILAALSGDAELIRRCRDADEGAKGDPEKDPHSFVASVVFGDAFWAADKKGRLTLRGIVKHCIYGMNYGAGAQKVHETIYKKGYDGPPLSVQQVKVIIRKIFDTFPGVESWRENTLRWSIEHQQVRSAILGRWREFPLGELDATVAWNFPIQATGADVINLRLVALKQRLAKMRSRALFMAQVHDAVYLLCPEEEVHKVKPAMAEELSVDIVIVEGAPVMPFAATPKVGNNWKEVS